MSKEIYRFRAINHKGKREYVFDEKGKYVRINGKFIKVDSKLVDSKNKDSELVKEINLWIKKNPKVKYQVKNIKNLDKKLYYVKTWVLTESNDLTVLPNHNRRGFKAFHLDHIYPISLGYKEAIPPEIIANIKNIRFVHFRTNLKKRDKLTERAIKIMSELLKS